MLAIVLFAGCLENLNQQKYFAKLHAASPELARRVEQHRDAIEQRLYAELEKSTPAPIEHVGFWGETQDFVRRVTDGEHLFMRGRIFHPQGRSSTYYLAFTVAEDGTVEIVDGRVFGGDRGLR